MLQRGALASEGGVRRCGCRHRTMTGWYDNDGGKEIKGSFVRIGRVYTYRHRGHVSEAR